MEVKCLEIRDRMTFIPVICIRPVPDNEAQRWLLREDGYSGADSERCIIMIDAQCNGVAYDPTYWKVRSPRTHYIAHAHIEAYWSSLSDGDVVDVEYLLKESDKPKISERQTRGGRHA